MTFDEWLNPQKLMLLEIYNPAQWPGVYTLMKSAWDSGYDNGIKEGYEEAMSEQFIIPDPFG